jgi:hypothetical protein
MLLLLRLPSVLVLLTLVKLSSQVRADRRAHEEEDEFGAWLAPAPAAELVAIFDCHGRE